MSYTSQIWRDGPTGGTPLSAARLTHMESGIQEASDRLDAGGGGGGGTQPAFVAAYIKNVSDFSLPNTGGSWQAMSGFEIDIAAAAGNLVELDVRAMRSATAGASVDFGLVVGSTIVKYLSTGTSSPALEGDPAWYGNNSFIGQSAPRRFSVVSGDLDSGTLRVALIANASGSGTIFSSTSYPWWWALTNFGSHT